MMELLTKILGEDVVDPRTSNQHVVDIKTPNPAVDSNDSKLLKMHWREDPKPTKTYSSIAKSLALPMLDQPVKSLLMSREIVAKFSTETDPHKV